jgi:cytosine/adenosine deaminase-related metal-dependent hydrolase
MSSDTVFANARIVTRTGVLDGSLRIADGKIAAIDAGPGGGRDMEGDYLLPGLVDIHTDNLEKHLAPSSIPSTSGSTAPHRGAARRWTWRRARWRRLRKAAS